MRAPEGVCRGDGAGLSLTRELNQLYQKEGIRPSREPPLQSHGSRPVQELGDQLGMWGSLGQVLLTSVSLSFLFLIF